jgi:hypothetical protein
MYVRIRKCKELSLGSWELQFARTQAYRDSVLEVSGESGNLEGQAVLTYLLNVRR